MSREHLYKAKRADWRELPKEEWWVEGYLYQNLVKAFIIFPHTGKARNGLFKTDVNTEFSAYVREVEPETVCEYTGLPDKNGTKIFEGDIVKGVAYSTDFIGYIVWIDAIAGFGVRYFNKHREPTAWENSSILKAIQRRKQPNEFQAEIIGNIFDNSELLEGGGVE